MDSLVIDTLQIVANEIVNTGVAIHEATGGGQFIDGVDNSVIGSVLSLLIAAIVRHFEKRKLKRKYKKENE